LRGRRSADAFCWFSLDCNDAVKGVSVCEGEIAMARNMFSGENFFDDFPDDIKKDEKPQKENTITGWYLYGLKKGYQKWCHACKREGVDSEHPECEPDLPYKFKCRYCRQSLRSHPFFGKGMIYDMAEYQKGWHFVNKIPKRGFKAT